MRAPVLVMLVVLASGCTAPTPAPPSSSPPGQEDVAVAASGPYGVGACRGWLAPTWVARVSITFGAAGHERHQDRSEEWSSQISAEGLSARVVADRWMDYAMADGDVAEGNISFQAWGEERRDSGSYNRVEFEGIPPTMYGGIRLAFHPLNASCTWSVTVGTEMESRAHSSDDVGAMDMTVEGKLDLDLGSGDRPMPGDPSAPRPSPLHFAGAVPVAKLRTANETDPHWADDGYLLIVGLPEKMLGEAPTADVQVDLVPETPA
jgi:hypothetical protein